MTVREAFEEAKKKQREYFVEEIAQREKQIALNEMENKTLRKEIKQFERDTEELKAYTQEEANKDLARKIGKKEVARLLK